MSAIEQEEEKLKNAVSDVQRKLKESKEQLAQWASQVDKQAHDNPWPLVAGVGVTCLVIGVLLGKSKG